MKILFVYPQYPETFWSFKHALKFISKKALLPPLGLLTVASMMPEGTSKKLVDTNDEWITSRSGIKERRIVSGDETASSLAVKAGEQALKHAGIDSKEIELIICATSIPDNLYPSMACEVQRELNCPKAAAFDITAACSGLIYGMNIAKNLIATGTYNNILLIAADVHSRFVNWEDRSTCVLFGDGSGAMLLKRAEDGQNDIMHVDMEADGFRGEELKIPLKGTNCPLVEANLDKNQHVYMNGREIYKFAVNTVPVSIKKALDNAGIGLNEVDCFILHQANIRIIESIADKLGVNRDKFFINLHKYGNTSAASVAIALMEAVESGHVKNPSTIVLSGFGAGLTWGTAVIRWRGATG